MVKVYYDTDANLDVLRGKFAKEWINENRKGGPVLNKLMEEMERHQIEKVGKFIRKTQG